MIFVNNALHSAPGDEKGKGGSQLAGVFFRRAINSYAVYGQLKKQNTTRGGICGISPVSNHGANFVYCLKN